ncbi:integrin alpha-M-like [Sardina pilchardus]|uniref:integrin alpha-M-like n=1 Tax=Sardina pilchardus TaxID=27697 RepID=UPI002E116800
MWSLLLSVQLLASCSSIALWPGAEGTTAADVVFLLDGSGSVRAKQFSVMKTFVKNLTRSLLEFNTSFAFAQYSIETIIHVNFHQFQRTGWENQVDSISQRRGRTYTADAIKTVVEELFDSSAGARPDAHRILIVLTDGKSDDASSYPNVTAQADGKNITRYAIGIGGAFSSPSAQEELRSIASSPDHVFKVDSFEALDNISSRLVKSIVFTEDSSLLCHPLPFNYTLHGLVFVPERMSWVEALHHCAERGSRLLHILDSCTQVRVEELLAMVALHRGCVEKAWVGLERCMINPHAPWEWSGGAVVGHYQRWSPSFPHKPCCFHCGQLLQEGAAPGQEHRTYRWQDACCREKLPFICAPANGTQPCQT